MEQSGMQDFNDVTFDGDNNDTDEEIPSETDSDTDSDESDDERLLHPPLKKSKTEGKNPQYLIKLLFRKICYLGGSYGVKLGVS